MQSLTDRFFNSLGLARLAKSSEIQQREADTRDVAIREIASGIAYDMRIYQNWMQSYWDPNPVHRSSKWTWSEYQNMDADPHIYNCFSIRKEQLTCRPYYVRSARPDDEFENFKAAFIAQMLDNIPQLAQKKREMLSALDNGFSVNEMIFDTADMVIPDKPLRKKGGTTKVIKGGTLKNAFVVADIKSRLTSAFTFDGLGNMSMLDVPPAQPGKMSTGYGSPRLLTAEELQHFLVLTHDPRFGWRGGWPLKATIFWSSIGKRAANIYRQIFIEKYGMPYLKGTYNTTDPAEQAKFETKLKSLQKNSWIMLPEGFALEFVTAMAVGRGASDSYSDAITFYDGNISEAILGHREAVTSPSGAFASAELKEAPLRQEKLESDATMLDSLFYDQMIRRVIDANFIPNGFYPYVVTDCEPESDLNKAVFRYSALYNMHVPLSVSQLREDLGVREPESIEDTLLMDDSGGADTNTFQDKTGGDNMKNIPNAEQIPEQAPGNPGSQKKRMSGGITMNITL